MSSGHKIAVKCIQKEKNLRVSCTHVSHDFDEMWECYL